MNKLLLSKILSSPRPTNLNRIRLQAEQRLQTLDYIKYTDICSDDINKFDAEKIKIANFKPEVYESKLTISESNESRLVFINGYFDQKNSNLTKIPSCIIAGSIIANNQLLRNDICIPDKNSRHGFIYDINTARFNDGAIIIVPNGVSFNRPIHVLFLNSQYDDDAVITFPRLRVVLGQNSSISLIEDYRGYGQYFAYASTEIFLNKNSKLNHERIQRESYSSIHISSLTSVIDTNSNYCCTNINLGGKSNHSEISTIMAQAGSQAELYGLAMVKDNQISTIRYNIEHQVDKCTTNQLYKIVANDSASSAFDGVIDIQNDVKNASARQYCKGIMLSPNAKINTKPRLQINTDDVQCVHAATIGQLDQEMLFYLQSRGLDIQLARNILVRAFIASIIDNIVTNSLKYDLHKIAVNYTHVPQNEIYYEHQGNKII